MEIAESFNHYFVNVGKFLVSDLTPLTNETFSRKVFETSFFPIPTTVEEIMVSIKYLKTNKAPVYDSIIPETIELIKDVTYSSQMQHSDEIFEEVLDDRLMSFLYKYLLSDLQYGFRIG